MTVQPNPSQRAWWATICILALAYMSLAFVFTNFWLLFVVPAVSFLALQALALSPWPAKEVLFKCADYVYYLLIGGTVALCTQILFKADRIEAFDRQLEREVLQHRLAFLDAELPDLRSRAAQARSTSDAIDQGYLAQCYAEQLVERTLRQEDNSQHSPPVLKLTPCSGALAVVEEALILSHQLGDREAERQAVAARLQDLPTTTVSPGPGATRVEYQELEFLWVPMLVLMGISIKLGKTTCSLWPIRKSP